MDKEIDGNDCYFCLIVFIYTKINSIILFNGFYLPIKIMSKNLLMKPNIGYKNLSNDVDP